jgi:hypothetical protein
MAKIDQLKIEIEQLLKRNSRNLSVGSPRKIGRAGIWKLKRILVPAGSIFLFRKRRYLHGESRDEAGGG